MTPILKVQQGYLRGKLCEDFYGGTYLSFQGIPYAKPPIGNLRFKAPEPPEPFDGVRDCTKEGSRPISKHVITKTVSGSEDCLFLNVYTPELTEPKAVMFYVYGGAFIMGAGDKDLYGPDFLISQNVVVVTINYRLGLFGFLSLKDPTLEVPGNAAIKDVVQALRWVQENITHFGGDPNNVTILGGCVGAVCVQQLILSPQGKGLFHKAIMQSGSALGTRGIGQWSTPLIKKALDLEEVNDRDIFNILNEMSAERIFQLQETIPDTYFPDVPRPFGIVQEAYQTKQMIKSEDPLDVLKSGDYNSVPLMLGYAAREGYLVGFHYKQHKASANFERQIPFPLKVQEGSQLSDYVANELKEFYFGNDLEQQRSDDFFVFVGDNVFVRPIYKSAKLHSLTSSTPVYLYRVSLDAELNRFKTVFNSNQKGAAHADELGYIFTHMKTPKIRPHSIEAKGVEMFTKLWTNFAKYGDPNPPDADPCKWGRWRPVQNGEMHFADLGENFTTGINPEEHRMAFWDRLEEKIANGM
ncbi:esterase B1-like [Photinus pyralis]|uniref:esterase B1-like n=1 Tax=Photinus pyralis TaxID=7054 RepID=UPI0012671B3A|nr:esterase B1-like [Photinus pyralis]